MDVRTQHGYIRMIVCEFIDMYSSVHIQTCKYTRMRGDVATGDVPLCVSPYRYIEQNANSHVHTIQIHHLQYLVE